jgi:chromosome segregation ATPase
MYKDSRNFVKEKQEEIRETWAENELLKQENFKLQIKTNEVTDYMSELKEIERDRDNIERSIKSIMSEPFLKKHNEKPMQQRIDEKQDQLNGLEKHAKKLSAGKQEYDESLQKKRSELAELTGRRNVLKGEYDE